MLKDLRYRLIVVLILVTGFCIGQEPVTIQIGDKSVEQDSIDTNRARTCILTDFELGYDFYTSNHNGFIQTGFEISQLGYSPRIDMGVGLKYSVEQKADKNHAVYIDFSFDNQYAIGSSINGFYTFGIEGSAFLKKNNADDQVFLSPMAGIGISRYSIYKIEALYKYNFIDRGNDFNSSSVLLKLSIQIFNTCNNR